MTAIERLAELRAQVDHLQVEALARLESIREFVRVAVERLD